MKEIRRDGGNHHETLGPKTTSGGSPHTSCNAARMSPDPAGMNTDTWSSKPK